MPVERRKGGQVAWDVRHGQHVQKKGSTDGFTDERGVLGAAEDVRCLKVCLMGRSPREAQ